MLPSTCREKTDSVSSLAWFRWNGNRGQCQNFQPYISRDVNVVTLTLMWRLNTVNSRLADTPLLRTLAITDKFQIPGESYRGLTENNSRYYGLSLLRNYGHFCGTNITILLFSLSMKRTLKSSHVTSLRKMAVCSSSFVNAHFKIVWKVYFLVRPVRLLSCRLFGFFTSACAFSF